MREKYVDEKIGIWFKFGQNADNTKVDVVSSTSGDLFTAISKEDADKLVAIQEAFRLEVYKITNNF